MLIELGDKRYTVTAKFKDWRKFQRSVTRLAGEAEAAESPMMKAASQDAIMDAGAAYLTEHVKSVHIKGEGDAWVADPDWHGNADEDLEPDEALALIGRVASPTESPFA